MTTVHAVANWIYHVLGFKGSGPWYGAWSGSLSDLGELAIIGGVWKMVNCHEDGCWRVGTKITTEDSGHHFRRCTRHHKERHA